MKATHSINGQIIIIDLSLERQFTTDIIERLILRLREHCSRVGINTEGINLAWTPNRCLIVDYREINDSVIFVIKLIWEFIAQYNESLYQLNNILSNFNK